MSWSRRQLGIAAIVAFELLALSFFALHAPRMDGSGSAIMRDVAVDAAAQRGSANVRVCLPAQQRDARFVDAAACVTHKQRVDALQDLVFEAKVLLENLDIVYWLDSGTLLGQYRMGDVMPWDGDGDLGILSDGLETLRASRVALSPGYELNVLGSTVHAAHDRDARLPARLVETSYGFYVDIFMFLATVETSAEDGQPTVMLGPKPSSCWISCARCPFVPGNGATQEREDAESVKHFEVPRDWILPTRPCYMSNFEVMCPAQPGLYLRHLYGDDFLAPKVW